MHKDPGFYFGYPECCRNTFPACGLNIVKSPVQDLFLGTGYVPCNECDKKDPMQLIAEINSRRDKRYKPFPIDGELWEMEYIQLISVQNRIFDYIAARSVLELTNDEIFATHDKAGVFLGTLQGRLSRMVPVGTRIGFGTGSYWVKDRANVRDILNQRWRMLIEEEVQKEIDFFSQEEDTRGFKNSWTA